MAREAERGPLNRPAGVDLKIKSESALLCIAVEQQPDESRGQKIENADSVDKGIHRGRIAVQDVDFEAKLKKQNNSQGNRS